MGKTIMDAINRNQKTFNNKPIYYLNTFLTFGKYKDLSIFHIIECDPSYLRWFFSKTPCYVADEVSMKLK